MTEKIIMNIRYYTWNYFVQLPLAEQVEYLTRLQKHFGASCQDIANYFGISKSFLYNHMKGIKAPHLNLKKTQSEAQANDWELWVSHRESGLEAQKQAKKEIQKKHLEQKVATATTAEKLEAEVKRRSYLEIPKTFMQFKKLIKVHQKRYVSKFLKEYGISYKLLAICMDCEAHTLASYVQNELGFPKGKRNRPSTEAIAKVCLFFANGDEIAAKAILDKYNSVRGGTSPVRIDFSKIDSSNLQTDSVLEESAVANDTEVKEHDVITCDPETKDVSKDDSELIVIKVGGCEFKIPADKRDLIPNILAVATSGDVLNVS